MNDEPINEIVWVIATPEKGVECFGERLGEFEDVKQILEDALLEIAERNDIPAGRLFWKENKYLGGGASYEIRDLAGPIQRRRH